MTEKICPYCKSTKISTIELNLGVETMRASIVHTTPVEVNTCDFCKHEWSTEINTRPPVVRKKKYKYTPEPKAKRERKVEKSTANYLRKRSKRARQL